MGPASAAGWRTAAIGAAMLYPGLLVVAATRLGPGVSPDSVKYASAARAFASSGELTSFSGAPLTIFPPGLPVLLGLAVSAGVDLEGAAIALNLVCVGLVVLLTYVLASQALRSTLLALLAAAAVGLSAATVRVFSMLWSEPPFCVLALAALALLARASDEQALPWWRILAVGALVSLATAIRFVGFTLIPIAALGALLATRSEGRRRATLAGLATGAAASIGLALVALRNVGLGAGPLGDRTPSGASIAGVVLDGLRTVGSFGVPSSLPLLATAVGALLACLLLHAAWRIARERTPALVLLAAFVAVYALSLGYGQIAARIDPVNQRLLAPVFTPLLILAIHAVRDLQRRFVGTSPGRLAAALRAGAAGMLVAASAVSMAQGSRFALDASRHGIGYNRVASLASPLALSLAGLPQDAGIATSDAARAYWTSGRSPIVQIPRADRPERTAERIRGFAERIGRHAVTYLAFFDAGEAVVTPEDLARSGIELRRVATFADGTLWEASATSLAAPPPHAAPGSTPPRPGLAAAQRSRIR
jgi:hypothetical protein